VNITEKSSFIKYYWGYGIFVSKKKKNNNNNKINNFWINEYKNKKSINDSN